MQPMTYTSRWKSIDWNRCRKNIEKLQTEIVQAVKNKDWIKVRKLQNIIVDSFSGKALAVKRQSKKKKDHSVPNDQYKTIALLVQKGYKPEHLQRKYIPKINGLRPLSIPTIFDRTMQTLYSMALDPIAETLADKFSYGFRKDRSTMDAVSHCLAILLKDNTNQWILKADIEKCFDNISHNWLLNHIPMDKDILKGWLKAGFISCGKVYPTDRGTPQGGNISSILMNMTLDGLEKLTLSLGAYIVRYADDFIIISSNKRSLVKNVIPAVQDFLAKRDLRLSEEKSKIVNISEEFDFLGQTICKREEKLIVTPSQKSLQEFLRKLEVFVMQNKLISQFELIDEINSKIIGWSQYHKYIYSKEAFIKVEQEVSRLCWIWAKSRHSSKSIQWIKNKYYIYDEQRNCWHFGIMTNKLKGLYHPTFLPQERYTRINPEYNPYDHKWFDYAKQRTATRENKQVCKGFVQIFAKNE
ncbi:MAG: reverse transcriptase N-terminal domain-containing protein [Holosporales bacterium]|jgi:RNA-directed DNA polymerase|nr:reverse transcriptase N-terminal domain-containing protein [Holosporales bacterium]